MNVSPFIIDLIGWVSLIGVAGAAFLKRRWAFLTVEAASFVLLGVHWVLKDQTVAAYLNWLFVGVNAYAIAIERFPRIAPTYWLSVPATIAVAAVGWHGFQDLVPMLATLLMLIAKREIESVRLRGWLIASTLLWGMVGVLAWSVPQMTLSAVALVAHGWHMRVALRQRPATA